VETKELDERILKLLAAGAHREAATVAIRGHGPQVLRYLQSVLGDHDDARDAFSQFAENLWRGLPTYRADGSFRAWAYRIAWNAAFDLRRHARRRRERFTTGEASRIAATVGTSSNERRERRQRALEELRMELSLEDRALAALRIDQDLSWEECAAALSSAEATLKPNTIAKRFERIKERLGKLARQRGLLEG
jgi:RNA polymerase sigma-70 factor (ECF subfamily)